MPRRFSRLTSENTRQVNSEVQLVFRKKTRGQVIGTELQEALTHIGVAATEAGHLAAEQFGPRVAAAREAAGPTFEAAVEAAQKAAALKVAPKVAAAVAVAAPAVASARDTLAPRVEAARGAIGPRVEAAREAAAPRVAAAVTAAQAAASKAAADLAPRVEAAQKALKDDVVPRLGAAQTAALAYATPRVAAAREAVAPALESARETLVAGVDSARSELDARRAELAAVAADGSRKARNAAKKARKRAGKKHREFEKSAIATAKTVKRKAAVEKSTRRWPWVFAALAVGTAVFVLLRRKKDDAWTPAPAGDGPVPSYREDPVPSSDSNSGKNVSTAMESAGDSTPNESDMGEQDAQLAGGDDVGSTTTQSGPPEPFTSGGADDPGPTAGPAGKQV